MPKPKGHHKQYKPLLSPQEYAVLSHLWDGMSRKEIATSMQLSEKTVKNYLHTLYAKLHAENSVQACRRAMEWGILRFTGRTGGEWP